MFWLDVAGLLLCILAIALIAASAGMPACLAL
jgi:hypothetical protein